MQESIGHIESRNHSEFEMCPSNKSEKAPAGTGTGTGTGTGPAEYRSAKVNFDDFCQYAPASGRPISPGRLLSSGWLRTDIWYDKGDKLLEVATNVRFNPEHFPSMSLSTMEKQLEKTIFPDGHRTADLTRPEDGPEDNIPLHPVH
jgi:hypothetical protein